MSRLPWCLLLLLLLLSGAPRAQVLPEHAYRVLLVGNSLTYTNNLPALLRAVGKAHGTPILTETWAAPGGTLAERANEGHVAAALRERRFDAVVLQERGGVLACVASADDIRTAPCAASMRVQRDFTALAKQAGARTLLFATWAPDERQQGRVARGTRQLAQRIGAEVFDAAGVLAALRKAQRATSPTPDGVHPSTQASLLLALALYRQISGQIPQARELRVDAPLLPVAAAVDAGSPMESQTGLRGDGRITVVPASLLAPLVHALPEPAPPGGKAR